MLFVGVDPDLHNTGIAWINDEGKLFDVETAKVDPDLLGTFAAAAMCNQVYCELGYMWKFRDEMLAAVEFPVVYPNMPQAKEAVCLLDLVAGAAGAWFGNRCTFVKPREWKGQIPKKDHQPIILDRAGLGGSSELTSHEIDALGLAYWRYDQWKEQQLREKYLNMEQGGGDGERV